jgi:formylglycine-generating enzyme required for sulfatase activity/tRNA A-37 threonylcarbamoyl transferase component Bud32
MPGEPPFIDLIRRVRASDADAAAKQALGSASAGETARLDALPSAAPVTPSDKPSAAVVAVVPDIPGYEILHELGRGGQSVVYKARHRELNRPVALKMILTGNMADAEERARFRREAEAVAHLHHPHIVQIYDIGEWNGQPYCALEFVAGVLANELRGEPQPADTAAALVATLARTMHSAHQQGIVHRDLKPGNVLLTEDGVPKITDFGLAKRLQAGHSLTQTGHNVMGTPAYMAPEQAAGRSKEVGPVADVYALGAILYEMLTGRPPFEGDTSWDIVSQVVSNEPEAPRRVHWAVPRDLETICLKCLHKEPEKRYASAAALADDLDRYRSGQPIRARRVGAVGRLVLWCRRKRALAATVFVACLAIAVVAGAAAVHHVLQERERARQMEATHAADLVQRLLDADIAQVPAVIAEIDTCRPFANPLLRERHAQADDDSRHKLHTSLALLAVDRTQVDYLCDRLLAAEPHEVPVLRDALAPHRKLVIERLWTALQQPASGLERLRAGCALARYDADGRRWDACAAALADELVAANPIFLGRWMEGLRPIRTRLLAPLANIFRDHERSETERTLATSILTDYAVDQPQALAELVMHADTRQFAAVFPKLRQHGQRALVLLEHEVDKALPSDAAPDAKEQSARRQANAAVALLRMGSAAKVWPLLRHRSDPRLRSYLIHRLGPLGTDARAIVGRLDHEPDVSIQRALILSLGEFVVREFGPHEHEALIRKLQELYRTADDPGLHSASEWLLRHWRQDAWLTETDAQWLNDPHRRSERRRRIARALTAEHGARQPQWYVNGQGQTMVVIPAPNEFWMGTPPGTPGRLDGELHHQKRIERTFAVATKPVTVGQFLRFRKGHAAHLRRHFAPTDDCPVHSVTWHDAAAYCNWLSEQEGLPREQWCYETNAQGQVTQIKEKYLRRAGYRLPTEAEWECACRAGAITNRHYGESDELLEKYAWYVKNSDQRSWPVGSLRPNDLGLFDMHGNNVCWCQNEFVREPREGADHAPDDGEGAGAMDDGRSRSIRGGSWLVFSRFCRSGYRGFNAPQTRWFSNGLRVAASIDMAQPR